MKCLNGVQAEAWVRGPGGGRVGRDPRGPPAALAPRVRAGHMGTRLCGQALLPPAEIFCPNLNLNSTQHHQCEGHTQNLKTGIHLEGKQKDLPFSRGPVPPSPPHPLNLVLPTVGPSPLLGLLRFHFLLGTGSSQSQRGPSIESGNKIATGHSSGHQPC